MTSTTAARQLDEDELIDNTRAGDSNSYGELYRRHVRAGRAAALALTHNRSDADDVTSEAFARVLRASRSGGGPNGSFRPYLMAAVRNVFFDRMRSNHEQPSDSMADWPSIAMSDRDSDGKSPAFATEALAGLPERWQTVLWQTEVEGRSSAEVAQLLGLEPNALAALTYRARKGLRQAYMRAPHPR
ncbi:MAG: sigma-70 family RNA polymerase sigma factor [Ilumatobacteraceae bacterium]